MERIAAFGKPQAAGFPRGKVGSTQVDIGGIDPGTTVKGINGECTYHPYPIDDRHQENNGLGRIGVPGQISSVVYP